MAIGGIFNKEYSSPNTLFNTRFRTVGQASDESSSEGGSGDSVNFSQDTLERLRSRIASNDNMTSSTVNATLDDGSSQTAISFNNSKGTITWGGNTLNLKNFANALEDDLVIRNAGGKIEVYNLTTQKKMTLNADGSQQMADGKLDESSVEAFSGTANGLSTGLFINNKGLTANSGGGNDILINRQADAKLNAGLGDDKIFNFAGTASALDGGGGNDAVYSVGLTHGADIDVSSGDGYVKLLGDMKGGSIDLGGGQNYVDASGRTLTGVNVKDGSTAEASVVVAKTVTGDSTVSLNAALTAVDVAQLASSTVNFGEGVNSLVADKISGTEGAKSNVTSKGTNTYQVGTVSHANFDSKGAKSDAIVARGNISDAEFALSKGENLLDATGKTLTAVKISSEAGTDSATTIKAGSIAGRNAEAMSTINLAGSKTGNTVDVSKAVKNATINTGAGIGTMNAGSVDNVILSMGGATSTAEQNVTISGKANKLLYTGAKGDDSIRISGAVSNSDFNLGEGDNSVIAQNAKGVNQKVSNTNFTATGTGSTTLVMGNYTYKNAAEAADGNKIVLGKGSNSVTMGSISGSGTAGLNMNLSAGGTNDQTVIINGSVKNLRYSGTDGEDNITVKGSVSNSGFDLGAGNNSFVAKSDKGVFQKVSNTDIDSYGTGSTTVSIGNYVYGAAGNSISLGNGSNTIEMGSISGKGTAGLAIDLEASTANDAVQKVLIKGAASRLSYSGATGNDDVTVMGAVSNSDIKLGAGDNSFTAQNAKGSYQKVSNTNITATGTGSSTVSIGNYVYGAEGNNITLGGGTNTVELGSVSGKGTVGLDINMTSAQAANVLIRSKANYLSYKGAAGADDITVRGAVKNSDINLGAGDNSFIAQNAKGSYQKITNTNITATGAGASTVKVGNYVYGTDGNAITLGNGANTIEMGSVSGKGSNGLDIDLRASTSTEADVVQNVTIRGAVNNLYYNGAAGADSLLIKGAVKNSEINLREGTNTFTAKSDKGSYQKISNTDIYATGSGATTVDVGGIVYSAEGNHINLGSGANSVTINGSVSGKGTDGFYVSLSTAKTEQQSLIIKGSANRLTYTGGEADDSVEITGTLNNSYVNLGAGNNNFTADGTKSKVTDTTITATGANDINITNFTSTKKGASDLKLGDGNDTVNLTKTSGNVTVDMGGGADNEFTAKTLNGSTLKSTGGGTYTIETGKNATMNFTGSTDALRLNIQSSLTGTMIDLGNGDVHIGSDYEEGKSSTANISGSTVNAGAGKLTVDANKIASTHINMTTEAAGDTARLDLSANSLHAQIDLGHGENTIKADTVSKSIINREKAGALKFDAGTVTGSSFNLKGDGSDTLNVTGDLNASLNLEGNGLDAVTVGGKISGTLGNTSDTVLTATTVSGLEADLKGNNVITTSAIENSKLIMGNGLNTINELPVVQEPSEEGEGTEGGEGGGTPAESSGGYNLNITSSTIQSGSDLSLKANNVTSSTVNMTPAEGGQASLDMDLSGELKSSTVNLSGGDSTISVNDMTDSDVNRTEAGNLGLTADSVSGGNINLAGAGNDTITVTNDLNATMVMGDGADVISAGGTIAGKLTASDSINVTATNMGGMQVDLSGANNTLNIAEVIYNSKLNLGDGNNTVGGAGSLYNGTVVTAGNGNNSIQGKTYTGGSITMGDGNNTINVTESLATTVNLGTGTNTVGTGSTSLNGFKFTGTGSNTIQGKDLVGGSVSMGADGKTNELILSGDMANSTVTLNGGTNTVGGTGLTISSSQITGGASGDNTIQADSLSGSKIDLGNSNDFIDIYGDISGSTIDLGGGLNNLRNTLTADEASQNITGQGSALNNKVVNSTIQLDGRTNVYLGQVSGGSSITATDENNINVAGLTNSTINASGMQGGQISAGTVNGDIITGVGGSININQIQTGSVLDESGQNTITVGTLAERASINVGDMIHSTTIHTNVLDGTVNLGNNNYAGSKQGNLTVGDANYNGTVKIGGSQVSGAGVETTDKDTSSFGKGSGTVIV